MNRCFRMLPRLALAAVTLAFVALSALPAAAQTFPGSNTASQSLRSYHFVFAAYAIAWLLIFGWVVAVARRLARLEKRLQD